MAAALPGKCIGLLALVLLLYSCCYAFRIRDHQPAEQTPHRAACTSIFGRCQERTSVSRKWPAARKPPVELTSADDDDRGLRDRAGRSDSRAQDSAELDDEDVIVEVEEDTDEELVSGQSGGDTEEENADDDEDEDEDEGGGEETDDDDDDDGDDDEDEDETIGTVTKAESEEEEKNSRARVGTVRSVEDSEGGKEKRNVADATRKVSLERGKKETVSVPSKNLGKVSEDDGEEDVDEDEDDEDEDEDDEPSSEVATPPPRKLEKVRHADKDKIRSAETTPTVEKPKVQAKEPRKVEKDEPVQKKITVTPKKPEEKPESPAKTVHATKKVEPVKITKSESESTKRTAAAKPEEKSKAPVKPEVPKTRAPPKAQAKTTAQSSPGKVAENKRSEKVESKAKAKARTEAPFTLARLNDAILRVPTFVPNFTAVEDFECQQHGKIFLRQLRGYKLWALQMLDAGAKVPSGLLRGNMNQLGDFDECLGVLAHVKLNEKTVKVQGKYCLANIDLYSTHPGTKLPVNLMQSRAFIRANMRDPGHFVPKFTTLKWAVCLPAACSHVDAQTVLEQELDDFNSTAGIKFVVDVDPNMCYVKQKPRSYSKETIAVLYFYATIVCLAVVATVRDYLVVSEGKGNYSERIIMSFSLRRTVRSLLKRGTSRGDMPCINGIRTIMTILLYIGHRTIPISNIPFSNRIEFTEMTNLPISSLARVSGLYTDAFLLLSGVLTAYNMAHEFVTRGEIRWFCRFIANYIRFTSPLLAVVFWYAFVMEHIGTGPQWNSIIMPNAELCKSNAWTNLLYIQNFFPFEEMCAAHTHHLALNMQLSFLAPMLVFFLECRPIIGILVMVFFVLLSATLRYIATVTNYLSLVVFHGIPLKHLYKTANFMYALPLHRATPYVFGVGLGVLLRYTGRDVRIHKVLVILGWLIAMALGSWSLFSPWHLARRDYVYDVEESTNYAVISPVLWALALCWLIFACCTNHGGVIDKFLSSHWLLVFSRISYAVYLTQFAVFFYNTGTIRYSTGFNVFQIIDLLEAVTVIAASVVLSLLFDFPMQDIKKVLMESTDTRTVEVPAKEKSPASAAAEEKKSAKVEQTGDGQVSEEDELFSRGWDWQRSAVDGGMKHDTEELEDEEHLQVPILKQQTNGRRSSFLARESSEPDTTTPRARMKDSSHRSSRDDDDDYRSKGRRSRSSQRDYQESETDSGRRQQDREESVKRGRRSVSKSRESKRLLTRDSESEEEHLRRRRREDRDDEQEEIDVERELEEDTMDDPRRYRRSQSRGRSVIREPDDYRTWEFVGKERSSSRGPDSKRLSSKSEERELVAQRQQTRPPPLSRSGDARRVHSSESDDELSAQRKKAEKKRYPSVEPRVSDEEDWESELRIRRKQFMEKLAAEQRDTLADEEEEEEKVSSTRRRSSAEGRIALLKDSTADVNMDAWTISLGSRVAQLGSSQEQSELEEDAAYTRRREYRERAPPPREDTQSEEDVIWDATRRRSYTSSSQVTSMDEEDDTATYNFILTKDSRMKSMQDLSRISQEDSELMDSGWNLVKNESVDASTRSPTTGLYKRESIIKSQASEEDPEFLLPERPKLVQQEREHPFKKAWQMQKSRSEEDGSAYVIKESKEQPKSEAQSPEGGEDKSEKPKADSGGEQYEDTGVFADDESESITLARSRSTDTEENLRTSSKSEEPDSLSTERSESSSGLEVNKGYPKSSDVEEDSLRSNWPSEEDEQLEVRETGPRSKSEEAEWSWEREET